MKNKRILLLLICLTSLFQTTNGQSTSFADNFYNFSAAMDTIFDTIASNQPDTVKIEGLESFERFKDFWRTRVYNDDTIEGNFSKYSEQLNYYHSNQQMLPSEGSIVNWEFAGPKNLSSHNQELLSVYI